MKYKLSFLLYAITSFVFILSACKSQKKKKQEQTTQQSAIPPHAKNAMITSSVMIGHSAFLRRDYKTAINSFNDALKLDPNHAEALYRLSQTEFAQGNLQIALDLAAKSYANNTHNVYWYDLHYAELLQEKGDKKEAAEILHKSLLLHNEEKFLYDKTSEAWVGVANFKKAEDVWKLYDAVFPEDRLKPRFKLAEIYYKQDALKKSLSLTSSLIQENPLDANILNLHFHNLVRLKDSSVNSFFYSLSKLSNITEFSNVFGMAYRHSVQIDHKEFEVVFLQKYLASNPKPDKFIQSSFIESLTKGKFKNEDGISATLIQAAQKNPLSKPLQTIAALSLLFEAKPLQSLSFFENGIQNNPFVMLENYTAYCKALLYCGRSQELQKIAEMGSHVYPRNTMYHYKALSLIGSEEFEDFMSETLPFVVEPNTKQAFNLYKNIHENLLKNKTTALVIPSDLIQNLDADRGLVLSYAVALFADVEFVADPKFDEMDRLLLNVFNLLKRKKPSEAVDMLMKHEKELAEVPLFCKLLSEALIQSGKNKEAEKYSSFLKTSGLDSNLLYQWKKP